MAKDIFLSDPFANGDFNVGLSDFQHIQHITVSNPGHHKNAPLLGVGIADLINGSFTPSEIADFERNIRLNLESDGAKQVTVSIDKTTKKISIDGKYD